MKLEELIPRILFERKSFLNVTEDSLRKEIDNSLKISEEDALDTEESREDTVEADQQEVFNKHKFELSKI